MNKILVKSILIALFLVVFTIVPIFAYAYSAQITVNESESNNYTDFPFNVFINNTYLDTSGYITDNGLDVNVSVNGTSVPRMVVGNRTLFVSDLAADHTITPLLTTGNTPTSSMEIIVGNDGEIVTLDDATLEIGASLFEFTVTGYFDTSLGANKYVIYKNGAINLQNDAAGQLTANFSGSTLSIAGIASGIHTVTIGATALHNYLTVDLTTETSVGAATAITANANNWYFMQNNVMPYANSIELKIAGTTVLDYEPVDILAILPVTNYSTGTTTFTTGSKIVTGAGGATWTRDMIGGQILYDLDNVNYRIVDVPAGNKITLDKEYLHAGGSGGTYVIGYWNTATIDDKSASTNDGTITFGANPLGVVSLISYLTTSTLLTSTPTIQPDMANMESNQGDLVATPYPNPTLSNNLLAPWFQPWAQITNIPMIAFFMIIGTVLLIVVVVFVLKKTNNQLIASFILIAGEAMLWKLGIYELWPVIVTAIICFAIIVWERKPSI